jgi:hypothetical protein
VFSVNLSHRRRIHIPNLTDRAALPWVNHRAHNVRPLPDRAGLARTTILVKSNNWAAADCVYIRMDNRNG